MVPGYAPGQHPHPDNDPDNGDNDSPDPPANGDAGQPPSPVDGGTNQLDALITGVWGPDGQAHTADDPTDAASVAFRGPGGTPPPPPAGATPPPPPAGGTPPPPPAGATPPPPAGDPGAGTGTPGSYPPVDLTKLDGEDVKKLGEDLLNATMQHKATFAKLTANWPNAGSWPTAQALEATWGDRTNGLLEHYQRLVTSTLRLKDYLQDTTKAFTGVDQSIAHEIETIDHNIEFGTPAGSQYSGSVFDRNGDANPYPGGGHGQFNHNLGAKPDAVNNADGDGYNDNLSSTPGNTTDHSATA